MERIAEILSSDESISQNKAFWGFAIPPASAPALPKDTPEAQPPTRKQAQMLALAQTLNEEPHPTNNIVYIHSIMAQIHMPRRRIDINSPQAERFERKSGAVSILIQPGELWNGTAFEKQELPYGPMPRFIMNHINTFAVQNQTQEIAMGDSARDFMQSVGLSNSGGKRGVYTTFKQQTKALAAARITMGHGKSTFKGELISQFDAWMQEDPKAPVLWPGRLILSDIYYESLIRSAVPLDHRVTMVLKSSALALDIYSWLAQRLNRIESGEVVEIPWAKLKEQFGSEYGDDAQGRKDFKAAFATQLKAVLQGYPKANVSKCDKKGQNYGLTLLSSPPPVPRRKPLPPKPTRSLA
jgi:Plasmid encoded RepA protein